MQDGTTFGPVNCIALRDLMLDGAIPPTARVWNKLTREETTLDKLKIND
jgi:hypothetical protein